MLELYIANKNYSSWSLRPWVLLHELGIPFEERLVPFGHAPTPEGFRAFSPSGKVPCLIDGTTVVWDSLAIVEYLAEREPAVWPEERVARAWARSVAAEMHSGFAALRAECSMSCGQRVRLSAPSAGLVADWARVDALWREGPERFGGPFLTGPRFTAVDAFFAPVAFRARTYSPELGPEARAYGELLLELASMRRWYDEALREPWRDEEHEADVRRVGEVLEDLRAPVPS